MRVFLSHFGVLGPGAARRALRLRGLFVSIGMAVGVGSVAHGQTVVESWNPLGWIYVDSVPDLDGDGFREIVVGDTIWEPAGAIGSSYGRIYVFSGLQKEILWEWNGIRSAQFFGGNARTVGDMDGDGFPDIGFSDASLTHFVSGKDGKQFHVLQGAYRCIESIGDMNGDDLADVLLNGYTVMLGGSYEFLPVSGVGSPNCAPMGDIDGDGVPDYIVGIPRSYTFFGRGQIFTVSGASGRGIHHLISKESGSDYGQAVASPGDFTGDGVPDFVVGEPRVSGIGNFNQDGTVYFYDGRTAELIDTLVGNPLPESELGRVLVPAGDVNGNGTRDLIIGSRPANLFVVDGATRETIYTLIGNTDATIRAGIDWTDDGIPDVLFNTLVNKSLISGAPIGTSVIGRGCARAGENVPRIGCTGSAHLGADFPVHLSGVEPGDGALLLIGAPGTSVIGEPIANTPQDCGIAVATTTWMRAEVETLRPGEAAATVTLPIPNDAALVGSTFELQWVVLEGRRPKALTRVLHVEVQTASSSTRTRAPISKTSRR